jgi:predicted RNA-binding Zn ribbon-like protein
MEAPRPYTFDFTGGHPALDFINTVGGIRGVRPKEHLLRFADVVGWGTAAGLLSQAEAKALGREAQAHPADAAKALERARTFREALYRLLLALMEGRPTPAEDAAIIEDAVQRAMASRRFKSTSKGYAWAAPEVTLTDSVVPRLALATAELVTTDALKRLRVCEAKRTDDCSWLFLDTTRNHSRRWCDMATCGNQHKARRHYARVRGRA